jgi:hypothetical protein
MKRNFILLTAFCLSLSACLPAVFQTNSASPIPVSDIDLQGTAAILSQQTLQALPSLTLAPSQTAVMLTATNTPIPATATQTQNPIMLSLTATLGTGTVIAGTQNPALLTLTATLNPGAVTTQIPLTVIPAASTSTPNPGFSTTPTETLHPQHYGTMPPNLPFGEITLINKSKSEVDISLQCTTKDGNVTIIEYPVGRTIQINAPAGKYVYVAWVGGKKIVGKFGLGKSQDMTITIYKDHVQIK